MKKNRLTKKNIESPVSPVPSSPKGTGPVEERFDLSKTTDLIKFFNRYKDDETKIRKGLKEEIEKIISNSTLSKDYIVLFLYDSTGSIIDFDLNKIYDSLVDVEPGKKDILLFVHSNGGSIEPAYLISKFCKEIARKFVVVLPRRAKSAATLLAFGADEIHMGPISQLGPIDPQINGRPALGLGNALEYLAKLVTKHPASSEMFAKYLNFELDLKQLGYFERVSESAVQYAERLLEKKSLPDSHTSAEVAREFTYSFKDHGFVIDRKEAEKYLGKDIVKTNTPELALAEQLFSRISDLDLYLDILRDQYLGISGSIEKGGFFFIAKKKKE